MKRTTLAAAALLAALGATGCSSSRNASRIVVMPPQVSPGTFGETTAWSGGEATVSLGAGDSLGWQLHQVHMARQASGPRHAQGE